MEKMRVVYSDQATSDSLKTGEFRRLMDRIKKKFGPRITAGMEEGHLVLEWKKEDKVREP